jgi:PPM family protein phosphatase
MPVCSWDPFSDENMFSPKLMAGCMKVKPGVEVAALSDIGRVRENNEDSYLYWEPESDADFERKGRLAVIADGMGGYEGGQEASRIAVETVCARYKESKLTDPQAAVAEAFRAAHQAIVSYALEHAEFHGMGTTCTALVLLGNQLHFAHLGDTRLYLVRGGEISRLTRDHSYVGRLVENGIVRAEDAESHPQRHILTAAMGVGREAATEISQKPEPVQAGDTLILCTDGLWGVVPERDIASAVTDLEPENACQKLIDLALRRGGPDNITLMILRISSSQ